MAIRRWLSAEAAARKAQAFEWTEWKQENNQMLLSPGGCPQQVNGDDCGFFMLLFAWHVSIDREFDFTQMQIPQFRSWCLQCMANFARRLLRAMHTTEPMRFGDTVATFGE